MTTIVAVAAEDEIEEMTGIGTMMKCFKLTLI
jgi:hypothetical protein